jgi:ankyrin repeat protein
MIRLLKKGKGDIEAKSDGGLTPLVSAINHGALESVVALLQEGARVDAPVPSWWDRDSLVHRTISWALFCEEHPQPLVSAVKALIKAGADLNKQDELGQTPLYNVCRRSRALEEELALILLAAGADPKLRDNNGDTALHNAADADRPRLVRELLRQGADVNSRDDSGNTPLHNACWEFKGDPAVLQALLKAGANIHAKNGEGKEPLDYTQEEHRAKIASILAGK